MPRKKQLKNILKKEFYYSTLDEANPHESFGLKLTSLKAKNYAKKINGFVKRRYHPEDEGTSFKIYKKTRVKGVKWKIKKQI